MTYVPNVIHICPNTSGYYRLAQMDGKDLMDPINGKWLKCYYA